MNGMQYMKIIAGHTRQLPGIFCSGSDLRVVQTLIREVLRQLYSTGRVPIIVDNWGVLNLQRILESAGFNLRNDAQSGDYPIRFDSLTEISRLRRMLQALSFEDQKTDQVISYLVFAGHLRDLDCRCGKSGSISLSEIAALGSVWKVEEKIQFLVDQGKIDSRKQADLLAHYAELSGAAADFDHTFYRLIPILSVADQTKKAESGDAIVYPVFSFASDDGMKNAMMEMIGSCLTGAENCMSYALIIFDSGDSGNFYQKLFSGLTSIPGICSAVFSRDAFLDPQQILYNRADCPLKIFTRHESAGSCAKLEEICGNVQKIYHTQAMSQDKRIFSGSILDHLLGTDKQETHTRNAPVPVPKFRKEEISSLRDGCAIIGYKGEYALMSFY
ncbi:MAG: hypothetical protein ACI4ET_06655 [Bilifractor sp.]